MLDLSIAILAAGKGTRLKLPYPKVLAPIMGKPMIFYVLQSVEEFISQTKIKAQIGLVLGHQSELVSQYLKTYKNIFPLKTAHQKEQKGTADAVKSYLGEIDNASNAPLTMIVCGDTPLLNSQVFSKLWETMKKQPQLDGVAATFMTQNPYGYGRIVKNAGTQSFIIREEKEASIEEKSIKEVNASLYLVKTAKLQKFMENLQNNNAAKEYYLTDLFQNNFVATTLTFDNDEEFLGVNDQDQLEKVTQLFRSKKVSQLRSQGVHIVDSQSTYLDWDMEVGEHSVIHPGCVLQEGTRIGKNCSIGPYAVLKNTQVDDNTNVHPFTVSQDSQIAQAAEIGPFARLRPGTQLGTKVKIGNFSTLR